MTHNSGESQFVKIPLNQVFKGTGGMLIRVLSYISDRVKKLKIYVDPSDHIETVK